MTDSNSVPSHAEDQGIGQGSVEIPTEGRVLPHGQGVDPPEGGEHTGQQINGDASQGDFQFHHQDDDDLGFEKRGGREARSEYERAQGSGPEVGSKLESPGRVETSSCDIESRARKAVMQAGESLVSGDYTGCLLALEAARQLPGSCTADVERLLLICRIHINSEAQAWRKVRIFAVASLRGFIALPKVSCFCTSGTVLHRICLIPNFGHVLHHGCDSYLGSDLPSSQPILLAS